VVGAHLGDVLHRSLADPSVDPAGSNAFVRTAEVIERRVRELLRRLALDAAAPRHPADPSAPDEAGAQP